MNTVNQLRLLVNQAIAEKKYTEHPPELYAPITYLMSLGGKRMRPVMLLLASDLFGGSVLECMDAAVAIELFHNFTLMHDDIMDKAPLRRGNATVHEKWNENAAILSGDAMLVEAYRLIQNVPDSCLRTVLNVFGATAEDVCRGQQLDMNYEEADEVTLADYLQMIRLKTAALLGGSMKIGALLAGASNHEADTMYSFGESLGLAFQIQDDILDVFGDLEKFGKQGGGDIQSNKKTWLLIKSKELAEGLDEEELTHWLNVENPDAPEKIRAVTAIYTRLGIRSLAEEEMNDHAEKALRALESLNVDAEKKKQFRAFGEQLLIREN